MGGEPGTQGKTGSSVPPPEPCAGLRYQEAPPALHSPAAGPRAPGASVSQLRLLTSTLPHTASPRAQLRVAAAAGSSVWTPRSPAHLQQPSSQLGSEASGLCLPPSPPSLAAPSAQWEGWVRLRVPEPSGLPGETGGLETMQTHNSLPPFLPSLPPLPRSPPDFRGGSFLNSPDSCPHHTTSQGRWPGAPPAPRPPTCACTCLMS